MRLRLNIKRHELPVVKILFAVSSTDYLPVSEFVSQVDEVVPLESEDWSKDDYIVSVGGFECLHYANVNDVFQNGDEVDIAAARTTDIHARQLAGRTQISQAGARLLDGVPYGRTRFRRSNRPAVNIPPLKRRRLMSPSNTDTDEQIAVAGEQPQRLLQYDVSEDEDEDDDSYTSQVQTIDSTDVEDEDAEVESPQAIPDDEIEALRREALEKRPPSRAKRHDPPRAAETGKKRKHVEIQDPLSEGEDEEEDEDFDVDEDDETGESSSGQSSSESPSDSDEDPSGTSSTINNATLDKQSGGVDSPSDESDESMSSTYSTSSISSTSSSTTSSESSSDDDNDDQESKSSPDRKPGRESSSALHVERQPAVTPGEGLTKTQKRNQRRKAAKSRKWQKQMASNKVVISGTDSSSEEMEEATQPADQTVMQNGDLVAQQAANPQKSSSHRQRRSPQEVAQSPEQPTVEDSNLAVQQASSPQESPSERRNRPTVGLAALRMIRQGMGKSIRGLAAKSEKQAPDAEARPIEGDQVKSTSQRSWTDNVSLSAVECCVNGIELPTPPFPFKQRWHGLSRAHFKERKGKRSRQSQAFQTNNASGRSNDSGNAMTGTDHYRTEMLNYDDDPDYAEDTPSAKRQHVESAHVQERIKQDEEQGYPLATATKIALSASDCHPGAFIYFTMLEMSAATGWVPQQAPFRTALIEKVEDETNMMLKVAWRDIPDESERDKKKRSAFNLPESEDEQETSRRHMTVQFHELTAAYLLKPAESKEANAEPDTQSSTQVIQDSVGSKTCEVA